ncbi:galactokinase [Agromyces kandeliae]|uniref:Galactokinase n=1 Tax=Agromyces kandeliae TaxID=2666141 RepID=A0A6L5R2F5_9MICO|nr:galactokinase [Agromyces kandeliae]MRX44189.1 galactokinase [Agromyces kandeliae]
MTDAVASAQHLFAEQYGRRPAGVWSAPGRANLIGEHTDYNDGFVFPFAIDRRTTVALGDRDDRVVRVSSTFSPDTIEVHLDELTPDAVSGWAAYPLGVVWALGESGADLAHVRGVDLHIDSDVPVGAGLSSSAAIECAVALALDEHWGLGFDRPTLAKVGRLAENRVVGAPTGIMDQSASLLGEADSGVFLDCRSLDADVIPLGFAEAGLSLLVIDTRVSHAHATGGYAARRASCEAGAAALGAASLREVAVDDLDRAQDLLDDETFRRVRHVVTENQRVLDTVRTLRELGPGAIGPLLDASHVSMRDDFEISVPELDLAVETAQANGAIGARMTGGGFGGAAIALVIDDLVPVVARKVVEAFAEHGFREPGVFTVHAAQGARRDA